MPRATIPPLLGRFPIVDPATGNPTLPFCKIWQDFFQNEAGTNQTAVDAATVAGAAVPETRVINTTAPLAGGGPLSADLTLSHNTSGVIAGSYGDATHAPQITINADGHVTAAVNVAISGGGGGGSVEWWLPYAPAAASVVLASGDGTNLTLTDDANVGLLFDAGASVTGDKSRVAERTIPSPAADWTFTVKMSAVFQEGNYAGYGISIRDSASGKLLFYKWDQTANLQVERFTALAGPFVSAALANERFIGGSPKEWLRVKYVSGTDTIQFWLSADGKAWTMIGTEVRATFLTNQPDKVGFGVVLNRNFNANIVGSIGYLVLA